MVGKNKGTVDLKKKHFMNLKHADTLIKLHCEIHKEAFYARTKNLQSVMYVITEKVVNIFLSNKLHHRQLLFEAQSINKDIL